MAAEGRGHSRWSSIDRASTDKEERGPSPSPGGSGEHQSRRSSFGSMLGGADQRGKAEGGAVSPIAMSHVAGSSRGGVGARRGSTASVIDRSPTTSESDLPSKESASARDEGLLCILDVAYANDQIDRIHIRVGDTAPPLAAAFAKKHGLEGQAVKVLEEFIDRTIQENASAGGKGGAGGLPPEHRSWIPNSLESSRNAKSSGDRLTPRERGNSQQEGEDATGGQAASVEQAAAIEQAQQDVMMLIAGEEQSTTPPPIKRRGSNNVLVAPYSAHGAGSILSTDRRSSWGVGNNTPLSSASPPAPSSYPPKRQRDVGGNAEEKTDAAMSPPIDHAPEMDWEAVTDDPTEANSDAAARRRGQSNSSSNSSGGGSRRGSSSPPPPLPLEDVYGEGANALEGEALFNKLKQAWQRAASGQGPPKPNDFVRGDGSNHNNDSSNNNNTSNSSGSNIPSYKAKKNQQGGGRLGWGHRGPVPVDAVKHIRSFTPEPKRRGDSKGHGNNKLRTTHIRLYEEAEQMRRKVKDAQERKAKHEEKELRDSQWSVPKRSRQVNEAHFVATPHNGDVGTRLHDMASKIRTERELASRRAAKEAEKIKDWVCPKCSHVNDWDLQVCQRVIGRSRPLVDEIPSAWVYVADDATSYYGRRPNMNEIHRCEQPRPELYTPTILSLQEYQKIYMSTLPITVRLRPENIFEDLFARRMEIEQKRRILCCQRWDEEKAGCTFQPDINEHSKMLVEERDRIRKALEAGDLDTAQPKDDNGKVYNSKLTRFWASHKQATHHLNCGFDNQLTFKPDIGVNKFSSRLETDTEFIERLAIDDAKKRREKINALAQTLRLTEGTYSPETTWRAKHARDFGGDYDSVNEYLYGQMKVLATRKEMAEKKAVDDIKAKASQKYTQGLSEKLIIEMKNRAYQNIFRSLFPDPASATIESELPLEQASLMSISNTGLIQALTLVLTRAEGGRRSSRGESPPPPGSSLSSSDNVMNFTEFCSRLDAHLHSHVSSLGDLLHQPCTASVEEKSTYILEQNKELTFHPEINPRSNSMAGKRWAVPEAMYDKLWREAAIKEAKLEERRQQIAEHILDECPFTPQMTWFEEDQPRYHYPDMKWLEEMGLMEGHGDNKEVLALLAGKDVKDLPPPLPPKEKYPYASPDQSPLRRGDSTVSPIRQNVDTIEAVKGVFSPLRRASMSTKPVPTPTTDHQSPMPPGSYLREFLRKGSSVVMDGDPMLTSHGPLLRASSSFSSRQNSFQFFDGTGNTASTSANRRGSFVMSGGGGGSLSRRGSFVMSGGGAGGGLTGSSTEGFVVSGGGRRASLNALSPPPAPPLEEVAEEEGGER